MKPLLVYLERFFVCLTIVFLAITLHSCASSSPPESIDEDTWFVPDTSHVGESNGID